MESTTFELQEEYIELIKLLKLMNIAASGGEAKHIVAAGEVLVNKEAEDRKRRKLRIGDVVEVFDARIEITEKPTAE